jgi:hypothetical protein
MLKTVMVEISMLTSTRGIVALVTLLMGNSKLDGRISRVPRI